LVATPRVHESAPVLKELIAFQSTGRRIIPVEIGDSLDRQKYSKSPLLPLIPAELLKINQAFQQGAIPNEAPPEVVRELRRGFKHVRQTQIRVRVLLGACLVLLGLLSIAVWQAFSAARQTAKAKATSVQADFDIAVLYQKQSDSVDPRTLAHLARALRRLPNAKLPRQYLVSLLRDSPWFLPQTEPMRHEGVVRAASFSSDGRPIVVTTSFDKTARVWDAESGKPVGEPMRHESAVYAASFSPDGRRIVTASYDKTARVWDAESGKPVGEPIRHESYVYAASFSPDGRRIVTASFNKTARVWDAESGKPVGEPMRHEESVHAASFSPDGRRIVTASDKTARVWDVAVDLETPLPEWVPELAEALGQRRFNEEGLLVSPKKSVGELRRELLTLKGDDFWSRLGRWFFMRGPQRTISPDSKITVGELVRQRSAETTEAKPTEE
jgi:hypothetical protein